MTVLRLFLSIPRLRFRDVLVGGYMGGGGGGLGHGRGAVRGK